MIGFLKALFGALAGFFRWLGDRQLLDAGKAQQANEAITETEKRVDRAIDAGDNLNSDPVRADKLRKRFDRAEGSE